MRVLIALLGAVLSAMPVFAQEKNITRVDKCAPISSLIAQKNFSTGSYGYGRLFIRLQGSYREIEYSWYGDELALQGYTSEPLRFIYVSPPSTDRARQFLSIRTITNNDPSTFVNLRKHHDQVDAVYFGRYQDYHRDGKASGILTHFHRNWPGRARSDEPETARKAWTFKGHENHARRRVLAISFLPSEKNTCVPFTLGPHLAASHLVDADGDGEGDDEVLGPFTIEIEEVKAGTTTVGRTFVIQSLPQRR